VADQTHSDDSERRRQERRVVAIVGAVQFVNILDFMMVMPLGPDFAKALGIPTSNLGLIGGSYTAAGAVAGVLGLFFLDRFGRRAALATAMAGLSVATLSGAMATDLHTLMAARVMAGVFGGPATSLAIAIVTDVVPAERRGRAMGAVMGAFSAASVLGVPLGLELARLSTWHAPFVAVAALGALIAVFARVMLPKLDGHLVVGGKAPALTKARLARLLSRHEVLLAYGLVGVTNFSSFLFIPNISAVLQQNFAFPREDLGFLYLVGGGISFFTMRGAGFLVDRLGSARLIAVGAIAFSLIVGSVGIWEMVFLPMTVVFALFMVFQSARNVSQQTMTSKVPSAEERAGYQSMQSAVQHGAAACGAVVSSSMLHEAAGRLEGMPTLAVVAMGVAVAGIPLAFGLEARLKRHSNQSSRPAGL
jgi:predicted MFS family arabinose efflux permease